MPLIADISRKLNIKESDFRNDLRDASGKIKHLKIDKKGGGKRKIIVPPWEFKIVQYSLILRFLRDIPIHPASTAFSPGSSIRENASRHLDGFFFVRMDFSEFFSSISSLDFIEILKQEHGDPYGLSEEFEDPDLVRSVFYKSHCVIGYPASPYLANITMTKFDRLVEQKLIEYKSDLGDFNYSRYADDITISITNKGKKFLVENIVRQAVLDSGVRNLKINPDKTKYGTRRSGNAFVTGMRICKDGRLTLHRKYKDHVRLLISLYSKGRLGSSDVPKLRGHLNYCFSADPDFYNKLCMKYFIEVEKIKK
ncbi:MAG: hypothetical protein ACJATD_000517 [Alloalcanivorax sp.]|jgi:RNA-directed DNA polymerase